MTATVQAHPRIIPRKHPEFKLKPRITKAAEKEIAKQNKKYIKLREPIGCRAILPIDERFDSDPTTLNWKYCQKSQHGGGSYCEHHSKLFQHDISLVRRSNELTKLFKLIK